MRLPSLLGALLQHARHPSPESPRQEPAMAGPDPESMLAMVVLECGGQISASQEEIHAASSNLGGDNDLTTSDENEEEVFATPPDATQQHQDDDPVTMCTLPFTPTPSKSRSPTPPSGDPPRKPRVCIRKVRGAKISTPTPSPDQQQLDRLPEQQPQPEQPAHVDPLVRAVLMVPTKTTTTTTRATTSMYPEQEFLALARRKGLI